MAAVFKVFLQIQRHGFETCSKLAKKISPDDLAVKMHLVN